MSVVLVVTGDRVIAGWSAFGSLIFIAPGVASLISALIVRYNSWLLLKGPVISRIKEYEAADAAYQVVQEEASKARHEAERQRREAERAKQAALLAQQRKRQQYWESLGGVEFERELGKLYRGRGYGVDWTPTSGDQGINIIPKRNGKTTVVQCKAHKRPAGPAVARELFGSMVAYGADNAILACTEGFTDGVVKFARGKPIDLISAWNIVRMAEESGGGTEDMTESPPICPNHGCGRTMVMREGKYGVFWGCTRYPTCRGTRDL